MLQFIARRLGIMALTMLCLTIVACPWAVAAALRLAVE